MQYFPTFRLFFDDAESNDYRLHGGGVEFMQSNGFWRKLDDSDLLLHFRFDTEVARWLRRHSVEANPHT